MKTAAFYTLGCKVNQYETEAMSELFKKAGYKTGAFDEKCDIYVINTCTVTGTGDKKSRQIIRRAKAQNPDAVIIVAGCYSQTAPDAVKKIDGVNIILGTDRRADIVNITEKYISENQTDVMCCVGDISQKCEYEELEISDYEEKTRAFVKIEDGCNEFCSYCIIPYARGRIRSRGLDSIVKEVNALSQNGFKEIVLTGIHLASYGRDTDNLTLKDAICAVHDIDGIERIRLGSIEPRVITEDFVKAISKMPKVCNHFHISLQSGCDETLKRMNRKYTANEFANGVKLLRQYFDNPAITTDIIVGFPGETDEEFNTTCEFVKKVKFSEAHIFAYSNRQGTRADKMPCQISKKTKEERSHTLTEICNKINAEYIKSLEGNICSALFEQKNADGMWEGHLTNYVKVCVKSDESLSGEIKSVKIETAEGGVCTATLV